MMPTGGPPAVVRAISDGMLVAEDDSVTNWVTARPGLADPLGNLRLGTITFVADGAGGLAGGLVCPDDRWVVTTDLEVRLVRPVREGRVRIVGRAVRAGSTTVVCDLDLFDDGSGDRVGVGSITSHALVTATPPSKDLWPRGQVVGRDDPDGGPQGSLAELLDLRVDGGGAVEIPVGDAVRNPWGILHGGVVAVGAEEAVLRHPEAAGRAPLGMLVRYLAPTRIGPARFVPELIGATADAAVFRVRSSDIGADGRVTGVTTVTLGPR
jgi:uncharacterized protein (TIGR00369 family)